ncbi:MAG TPA: hypothetical protein PLM14_16575 [Candidatus Hydrogenedentes bacterium]|nr:hypothetical protein [Candidatus Hydrogenedentota bacterium]HQE84617.1 hypothetical protein [Candidatus Hydrogenedentota bacterium]HQH52786.1 hypothetical protein [Candidatus Hydrogenedentota bacterium]HQM49115.1 hypothetical protein [Candidatus Hydrogenedentota bacterium]
MLEQLRAHDAKMVELECGQGSMLIPPSLNGRIFCQLGGELVHRLDGKALAHPSPAEYDNLGGNSLWPAPEGGPFAFNYLPGSNTWTVQHGIAKAVPRVFRDDRNCVGIEKRIVLTNRKGTRVDLEYRRLVSARDIRPLVEEYALEGMCYHTEDTFEPLGEYDPEKVLLAPWSLEQFPGADGVVAFGKVAELEDALNCDFYGDPGDRIARRRDHFSFRLGGKARHQIGVRVQSEPQFIGALDRGRSMLFLRKTPPLQGVYFNIADNDQLAGPFSTADLYSIFNGGELGFFELETIGAMQAAGDRLLASTLLSETLILRGTQSGLLRYLSEEEGLQLDEPAMSTLA